MTDLEKKIFAFAEKNGLFEGCCGLVLAVSGGPDSMAMLHFFEKHRKEFAFPLVCATVDHKIREESRKEAEAVRNFCSEKEIPFELLEADIPSDCPKGVSTETYARQVRYGFFFSVKEKYGFSHIATAHTSDDNAETVLMNIIRGCAVSGLSGIPAKRDDGVIRPLLQCEKKELINYCESENIRYFTDKTNAENIYRRNVIRNTVIPLLEKENPSVKKSLNRLSYAANADEKYLSEKADEFLRSATFKENSVSFPLNKAKKTDEAVLSRAVRKAFFRLSKKEMPFDMTEDVMSLFEKGLTSDRVQLYDFYAVRGYSSVDIVSGSDASKSREENIGFLQINAKINTEIPFFNGIVKIVERKAPYKKNKNCIPVLPLENAVFRNRREGDVFRNIKTGKKPLRRLFIDRKIPASERSTLPLLELDGEIIWAAHIGTAANVRADGCDVFYEIVFGNAADFE